jgi:hypothetical protein
LVVDSQTLWDQIEALARHLDASYQALRDEVFASPLIHADETYWLMLSKGTGKKWFAWTVASPSAVYHKIFDSRSTVTAKEVLGEYHGNVVADGYEPYQTVARAGPDGVPRYTLAFCWAHYLEFGVIWSLGLFGSLTRLSRGSARDRLQIMACCHSDSRNARSLGDGRQRVVDRWSSPARAQKAWSTSRFI